MLNYNLLYVELLNGENILLEKTTDNISDDYINHLADFYRQKILQMNFFGNRTPVSLLLKENSKLVKKVEVFNYQDEEKKDNMYMAKYLKFGVVYNNQLVKTFKYLDDADDFLKFCLYKINEFIKKEPFSFEFSRLKELKIVRLLGFCDDIVDNFDYKNTVKVVEIRSELTFFSNYIIKKELEEPYFGLLTFK